MVRRWHCPSGPWHFCLTTDWCMICTEHPQDLLVPSHTALRLPRCPGSPTSAKTHPAASSAGWAAGELHGGGRRAGQLLRV